jgi:hypothetical protein
LFTCRCFTGLIAESLYYIIDEAAVIERNLTVYLTARVSLRFLYRHRKAGFLSGGGDENYSFECVNLVHHVSGVCLSRTFVNRSSSIPDIHLRPDTVELGPLAAPSVPV